MSNDDDDDGDGNGDMVAAAKRWLRALQ